MEHCDPEADILRARRAYWQHLLRRRVDGRLVGTLGSLARADDTVVILVGDHGDMLGERGLWYKMSFYEGASRIPLVVHAPGRFLPRRVAEPVSIVDLLPTLMELAGASPADAVEPLAGASLLPLCVGDENADERTAYGEYMAEASVAPIVMVRRGSLKFVHCPADPDQLYDLVEDPHERVNLAADPHWASGRRTFREVAQRWDLDCLFHEVLADQARRRLVAEALRQGAFTPWDYTPPRSGGSEYMRNHLDLNDVERNARWPR
jgi:choline-sulfatase